MIKAILDYLLQLCDNHYSKLEGSLVQFLPLVSRILLDYSFMVMKVRANIRYVGLLRTLRKVIQGQGIYGFFAGWRLYIVLFPFWVMNMFLANVLFLLLKKLLYSRKSLGSDSDKKDGTKKESDDTDSRADPKGNGRPGFFRVRSAIF